MLKNANHRLSFQRSATVVFHNTTVERKQPRPQGRAGQISKRRDLLRVPTSSYLRLVLTQGQQSLPNPLADLCEPYNPGPGDPIPIPPATETGLRSLLSVCPASLLSPSSLQTIPARLHCLQEQTCPTGCSLIGLIPLLDFSWKAYFDTASSFER